MGSRCNGFCCEIIIVTDFMLVDTMFESHLNGYLSTGNGCHCVMVLATDFILLDTMFESHLYDSLRTGNEFCCLMIIVWVDTYW